MVRQSTCTTVTGGAQSSAGDGSTLMPPAKTTGPVADLCCKMRMAAWNVMSLSGTGYQEALVRELARLNISIAGITEARLWAVTVAVSTQP